MSLDLMAKRMAKTGKTADNAQARMIARKQAVLKDAIYNSYFGMDIKRPDTKDTETSYRVLITASTSGLSDTETKKYISSFFEVGLDIGSVIYWERDNSYWLIYEKNHFFQK